MKTGSRGAASLAYSTVKNKPMFSMQDSILLLYLAGNTSVWAIKLMSASTACWNHGIAVTLCSIFNLDFFVGTGCLFALADVTLKWSADGAEARHFGLLGYLENQSTGRESQGRFHFLSYITTCSDIGSTNWFTHVNGFTFLHNAPLVTAHLRSGGAGV